jgi:hypothetical protein
MTPETEQNVRNEDLLTLATALPAELDTAYPG